MRRARREPDAVDSGGRADLAELHQAGAVGAGPAVDEDEHGHGAAPVAGLAVTPLPGELFELTEQPGRFGAGDEVRAGQRAVCGRGVRQPLQPVPVVPRPRVAESGEHHLGG